MGKSPVKTIRYNCCKCYVNDSIHQESITDSIQWKSVEDGVKLFFIFIFKFILNLIKTLCRMKSNMGKIYKNTTFNCGKKAPKQKINPEIFEANDVIFD